MDDDEEEDVAFKPGAVIDSSKAKYVVIKLLGEGGFGAVYKVCDQSDSLKEYALKVEKKLQNRRHSKLKMEVQQDECLVKVWTCSWLARVAEFRPVCWKVQKRNNKGNDFIVIAILKLVSAERSQSHFTTIVDRGKKETFFFLVMQLVGKSLANLKKTRPFRVFSMSTGLGVGIQCLEACQDLHKFGFIHRDLKPANYACGLGEKKRIVYILDFGIARKILNLKGEIKAPREYVKFKGTIRFASLACHTNVEMGPKDDCESWFYLLLDLILSRGLLWKSVYNKDDVMSLKRDMRYEKKDIAFAGLNCKAELCKIMEYIDSLQYQDHVDYDYIYKLCEMSAKAEGGDINNPYDWEVGEDPTQTGTECEKVDEAARVSTLKRKDRKLIAAQKEKNTAKHEEEGLLMGDSDKVANKELASFQQHRLNQKRRVLSYIKRGSTKRKSRLSLKKENKNKTEMLELESHIRTSRTKRSLRSRRLKSKSAHRKYSHKRVACRRRRQRKESTSETSSSCSKR